MGTRKLQIAVLAAIFLVTVTAGCGGGSSTNGVESKSATEIVEAAQKAAESAKSVRVHGSIASAGRQLSLDLEILQGKGAKGTIAEGPLSFQLIRVGESIYIKGSEAFYSHFAGSEAAKLLQGKWLQAPANSSEFQTLGSLTDMHSLIDAVLGTHGNLEKGGNSTISGQKVVAVKDIAKGGTLYVATTGKPYPIQIASSGGGGGAVNFEDWDASVSISPPSNSVNIEKLRSKG
jgi:hypothetical protein